MVIHTRLKPTLANLPLAAVDLSDKTFQISSATPADHSDIVDRLVKSLAGVGLLNPPLVAATGTKDRWRIVSGFRRFAACAASGLEIVPARCLPTETTAATCALMAIGENALQRPLNLLEQVRASRLLLTHFADAPDLKRLAQGAGMAPNLKLLRQLAFLGEAPASLSQAILEGIVPLPMALDLMARNIEETSALASLFGDLRLGLNRQRETLGLLDDISHRDGASVTQILAELVSQVGAADPDIERPMRCNQLRAALRQRRYPHLATAELARSQALKAIRLSPGMQLVPPLNFEGQGFQMKLHFSDLDELEAHKVRIEALLKDSAFADLLR
jgi:ParB family transcriptional regulator, chromosome partitioning protein